MNNRFNPALLRSARAEISMYQKKAFVAFGPNGEVAAQAQQQQAQQQGQPGQPGADPAAMGGAPGGQPPAQPPQAPPQGQPQQAPAGGDPSQAGGDPGQSDQMRSVIREELERNEQKPKKLSIQDRVTQLEGLLLRVMEHGGLIPTDPNLTNQQPSSTGVDAPASTQVPPMGGAPGAPATPPAGGAKTAAAHDALLHSMLSSIREQFIMGCEDMERVASETSDAHVVGGVDYNPIPTQELGEQDIFKAPEQFEFAKTINSYYENQP